MRFFAVKINAATLTNDCYDATLKSRDSYSHKHIDHKVDIHMAICNNDHIQQYHTMTRERTNNGMKRKSSTTQLSVECCEMQCVGPYLLYMLLTLTTNRAIYVYLHSKIVK